MRTIKTVRMKVMPSKPPRILFEDSALFLYSLFAFIL
jgi:hypothetical protein